MVRDMVRTFVCPGFKLLLALVLLGMFLSASSGCVSRQYKVTLRNEQVIPARTRPKLDKATATYSFKDLSGQKLTIPAYMIREIEIR
jgi:hypothetical protein